MNISIALLLKFFFLCMIAASRLTGVLLFVKRKVKKGVE